MSKPLIADLDETIFSGSLEIEALSRMALRRPLQALRLAFLPAAARKRALSGLSGYPLPEPGSLPINARFVEWLRLQREAGRKIVLTTALPQDLAHRAVCALGFDDIRSLGAELATPEARSRMLIDWFGEKGFDYAGTAETNPALWQAADKAILVSSAPETGGSLGRIDNLDEVVASEKSSWFPSIVKAMRVHQWTKNLLVLVPFFLAKLDNPLKGAALSILAALIFSAVASSVYILNDIIDLDNDRAHATKRRRPFASGALPLAVGWALWPIALVTSLLGCLFLMPLPFLGILVFYYAFTLFYSLKLKKVPLLDVISLACLYAIRIVAGAFAISAPVSFWLLTFSIFIFLSLAFTKRYSELAAMRQEDANQKLLGRGYESADLELISTMGISSGYIAVLVLALFIQGGQTTNLYTSPELIWGAIPLVLFWISRVWLIAHRGDMHDDPVLFALKDRVSWFIGAAVSVTFFLARIA